MKDDFDKTYRAWRHHASRAGRDAIKQREENEKVIRESLRKHQREVEENARRAEDGKKRSNEKK